MSTLCRWPFRKCNGFRIVQRLRSRSIAAIYRPNSVHAVRKGARSSSGTIHHVQRVLRWHVPAVNWKHGLRGMQRWKGRKQVGAEYLFFLRRWKVQRRRSQQLHEVRPHHMV